jgi:hypothetical protein
VNFAEFARQVDKRSQPRLARPALLTSSREDGATRAAEFVRILTGITCNGRTSHEVRYVLVRGPEDDEARPIDVLQTGDKRLVPRIVGQAEQENRRGEHEANGEPVFLAACSPDSVTQGEGNDEVDHMVHQVIELDAVERRHAAQAGNLAVDVIEQVPELEEHRACQPTGRPSPAKANRGGERDEQTERSDGICRDSPRCDDPGDSQGHWPTDTAGHPVARSAKVGLLAAGFKLGETGSAHQNSGSSSEAAWECQAMRQSP